jgi:hypothetical protein
MRGRKVARALGAPSRDALRGILRGDAKRALDCALPAPGDGHTHEEQAARDARGVRANCADRGLDRSHRFLCLATI